MIININIETQDILNGLRGVSHERLIEFIKELDRDVQDWGFTETLYKYFSGEMKKLEEEEINATRNQADR